ncbi:HNH endonuclease [Bacillus norwichensis]|uniref:HNH endonuclease n=1 Tax=Bacillus norwichensis TaxID=2762217 RepID=A0ABR8VIH1_9BACI|nr:HNH endonuclease [Bacillus norwichensis]MBD8004547.1 HNH endonuclease [Bacillus norwichensis]
MKANKREINGYIIVYKPDHPSCFKKGSNAGYIYEHILVAELMLGRQLYEDEVVHHLNFNRQDNRKRNLLVLLKGQHTKIHSWINRTGLKEQIEADAPEEYYIEQCKNCFEYLLQNDKFCSKECQAEYYEKKKKERPSKEELEEMLRSMNKVQIANKFNVSRSSIQVWAREYGIA